MDEKTLLAIIRRIDDAERRIMSRIMRLESFKSKVVGGAFVISGLISVCVEYLLKK